MITWDEAVKNALAMLEHKDQYAYFYGAKGQRLTDELMEYFWKAEPAHFSRYTKAEKKAIFDYSRGKIGYDCSGFVCECFKCPQMWSGSLINACKDVTTDMAKGPAASLLYTTFGGIGRHVGIDIGYGFYCHMGREGHSVELGRFKEHTLAWEKSGQLQRYCDYTGATNR